MERYLLINMSFQFTCVHMITQYIFSECFTIIGTISSHDGTWHVLAYCKLRKEDVLVEIKSAKDDTDLEHFTNIATKLMNIRHPNLMTPVSCTFYLFYPRTFDFY